MSRVGVSIWDANRVESFGVLLYQIFRNLDPVSLPWFGCLELEFRYGVLTGSRISVRHFINFFEISTRLVYLVWVSRVRVSILDANRVERFGVLFH